MAAHGAKEPTGLSQVEVIRFTMPVGMGAVLAALASLSACYIGIVSRAVLGVETVGVNPHFQAVLMWGLALIAVVFLSRDRSQHHANVPLIVGFTAAFILIATLYLGYDERVEALAYVLLTIATLLNQIFLLSTLHRRVREQSREIEALNEELVGQVAEQEDQIDRLGRLKNFLAPQVAELVIADGKDTLLQTHRRYIACMFCDIRGFTAASEALEPEEVIAIIREFHDRAGALVAARSGTIGFRAGDGLMVFFNDPVPCKAPVFEAVSAAREVRHAFREMREPWQRLGHTFGLGIGIASGYATLGLVGHQGRADYTAIGPVVNAAARLCDAAEDGDILISKRAFLDVEEDIETTALEPLALKGFAKPVEVLAIADTAPAGAPNDPGH